MVRLSLHDKAAIKQASQAARAMTSTELVVVVAHASDSYRTVALACGVALGSVAALVAWHTALITAFPPLLCTQLAVAACLSLLPVTRHLCRWLAPRRLLHYRAAQRAAAEYVRLTHHVAPDAPLVLLYLSLAERYAHIHASRGVRQHIHDNVWNEVIDTLTASVRREGLSAGIAKALDHAARLLQPHFPATKHERPVKPHVVELKEPS